MPTPFSLKRLLLFALRALFPRERRAAAVERLSVQQLHALVEPLTLRRRGVAVRTFFSYDCDSVATLIGALKYEGCRRAAELLGEVLADTLLEELSDTLAYGERPVLLLPVPLSDKRLRERGYNQSEWIAQAAVTGLRGRAELSRALVRTRDTPAQTKLPRSGRIVNVAGAFAIPTPETVAGRHCIIVDDVVTTGSTLYEARRALMRAGAASAECVALARA